MKVWVDKNKCIGCGLCVSLAGEIFEMKEDGKSHVKQEADFEKNKEIIKQAKDSCPVQAINVEED